MRRFGNLDNEEVIACYVSAFREDGLDEVEFEKQIELMKRERGEELVQLSEELEKLEVVSKIDNKDFFRQASIYLLSTEDGTTMQEASEKYEQLEQERDARPEGDYGKIIKALELPKYDSPKEKSKIEKAHEEPQREEHQDETVEWIHGGEVKLKLLKRKYRR